MKINNLGGRGPETGKDEVLVFENVFPWSNLSQIDCRVSVNDESTYQPFDVVANGYPRAPNGDFCQINVQTGTNVKLEFELIDHESGERTEAPGPFFFSVWDFDHSKGGSAKETVFVDDYANATLFPDSLVDRTLNPDSDKQLDTFESTVYGNASDNPNHPWACTRRQLQKTVTFLFASGTQQINLDLKAGPTGDMKDGRNFLFAGATEAVCVPKYPDQPWREWRPLKKVDRNE